MCSTETRSSRHSTVEMAGWLLLMGRLEVGECLPGNAVAVGPHPVNGDLVEPALLQPAERVAVAGNGIRGPCPEPGSWWAPTALYHSPYAVVTGSRSSRSRRPSHSANRATLLDAVSGAFPSTSASGPGVPAPTPASMRPADK